MFGVAWIKDSEDEPDFLGLFIRRDQDFLNEFRQEPLHQTLKLGYELVNIDPEFSCRSTLPTTRACLAQGWLTEPISSHYPGLNCFVALETVLDEKSGFLHDGALVAKYQVRSTVFNDDPGIQMCNLTLRSMSANFAAFLGDSTHTDIAIKVETDTTYSRLHLKLDC